MKEKQIGMYGETPHVKIGKFVISRQDKTQIWIEDEGEDGGAFSEADLEKHIEKFYNKYF